MTKCRTGKDFWAGVMFLGFGIFDLIFSRKYSLGSSGEMGPGYFPIMLGLVLIALGLPLILRAVISGDEPVPGFALRPLLLLVTGVLTFGVTIERLGLVLSIILTVVVAALAGQRVRRGELGALAIGLAALSVVIFYFALRLPLPIWPSF